MRPLVLYHANCADGFGAAFAAWLQLGDAAEYVPMHYLKNDAPVADFVAAIDGRPTGGRDVYVLDFSLPKEVMEFLFTYADRVVWLDHHASVFKDWGLTPDRVRTEEDVHVVQATHVVTLDNSKSGALLAWEYFHPEIEVPLFIRHIDDGDRWVFALEGTKTFTKAIWSHAPWSFEQWRDWFYDCEAQFSHTFWSDFYTEGEAILRAHNQNVQSVVRGAARECWIEPAIINSMDSYHAPWVWWTDGDFGDTVGVKGFSANCPPHLHSDVGHELALKSGTFGLVWHQDKEGVVRCGLRSNGDYDVSAIAKVLGGGGHRNAAGFSTDIRTLQSWLR